MASTEQETKRWGHKEKLQAYADAMLHMYKDEPPYQQEMIRTLLQCNPGKAKHYYYYKAMEALERTTQAPRTPRSSSRQITDTMDEILSFGGEGVFRNK